MKRVKLFISDIDGCIGEPYQPYDLGALMEIAQFAEEAEREHRLSGDIGLPRFSLCSGRAYAYVEALTQVLNIRAPVLFESGGGMFFMPEAAVKWNPRFTSEMDEELEAVRHWMKTELIPGTSLLFDYGKRTQAGVISADQEQVAALVPVAKRFVSENFPDLVAYHTHVSIDVLPKGIEKAQAVAWMADELEISIDEIAFIGDTNGDIGALRAVGHSFAPANAREEVMEIVGRVTKSSCTAGVIEAYRECLSRNHENRKAMPKRRSGPLPQT